MQAGAIVGKCGAGPCKCNKCSGVRKLYQRKLYSSLSCGAHCKCHCKCLMCQSATSRVVANARSVMLKAAASPDLPKPSLLEDTYKEQARKYRRTVFNFEKWAQHRTSDRYLKNLSTMIGSRIIWSLAKPIGFTLFAATLIGLYETAVDQGLLHTAHITIPMEPMTLTSFALSLLLVFRTNTGYFRWNEARTIWGGVLNRSRDIMRQGLTFFADDDMEGKKRLGRWTSAFSKALRCHLRKDDDFYTVLKPILTEDELVRVLNAPNKPVYVIHMLSEIIGRANLPGLREQLMHNNLTFFHDSLGACERLLGTPIPLSYTRHTCRFLLLWLLVLPCALWSKLHWSVIPVETFIAGLLLGIEEIGVQIEEPFGILALEAISDKAHNDVVTQLDYHVNTKLFLEAEDNQLGITSGNKKHLVGANTSS